MVKCNFVFDMYLFPDKVAENINTLGRFPVKYLTYNFRTKQD